MGSVYKRTYKDKKTGETKESAIYWISYYRNGVQQRESAKTAVYDEAKTPLALREGAVAHGIPVTPNMGRIKFSELARDVENDCLNNHRRSLKCVEGYFRLHFESVLR